MFNVTKLTRNSFQLLSLGTISRNTIQLSKYSTISTISSNTKRKLIRNVRYFSEFGETNTTNNKNNYMMKTIGIIGLLLISIPIIKGLTELTTSSSDILDNKEIGTNYIKNYCDTNKDAIMTKSGIVFHELKPGNGPKVSQKYTK